MVTKTLFLLMCTTKTKFKDLSTTNKKITILYEKFVLIIVAFFLIGYQISACPWAPTAPRTALVVKA